MIMLTGERQVKEDGSPAAAQHISPPRDRQDAERCDGGQAHSRRSQTGHRRHHRHVREPSRCSRLHVWREDTCHVETGEYTQFFRIQDKNSSSEVYSLRTLRPELIPVSQQLKPAIEPTAAITFFQAHCYLSSRKDIEIPLQFLLFSGPINIWSREPLYTTVWWLVHWPLMGEHLVEERGAQGSGTPPTAVLIVPDIALPTQRIISYCPLYNTMCDAN